MKPAHTELRWTTEPPNARQASRIVAWIALAGAVVFGILLTGLFFTGEGIGDWRSLFIISIAFVQLILQAGTSALSWRIGFGFAMLLLTTILLLACIWFACSYNAKQLYFLIVPAIVSITAVTIGFRESQDRFDG